MQIPIPSLEDGSPDWSIVSRAWWDAVDLIERSEKRGVFACDMALELRVMGLQGWRGRRYHLGRWG